MSDVNYGILSAGLENPMDSFSRYLQIGANVRNASLNAQARMAQVEAERAETERKTAETAAEQDRQAKLSVLMDRLWKPGATAADYAQVASLLPKDQSEAVREGFKLMRSEEQAAALNDTSQVFAAIKSGNLDLAKTLISKQAEAETAGGNATGASLAGEWLKMLDAGPDAVHGVETMLGYAMTQLPGGDKAIEAINKLEAESRAAKEHPIILAQKQAELDKATTEAQKSAIDLKYAERIKEAELAKSGADLGLTQAQTDETVARTKKLGVEIGAAELALKAKQANGKGVDPAEVFNMEKKLRDEYNSRTSRFTDAQSAHDTIVASATDGTGAGDLALVTSFMKMLDPGSVVRETEFANAQNTAGLLDKLKAAETKLQNGQFLSAGQRREFAALADKYMAAASKYEKQVRTDMAGVADYWGIDKNNVFGASRAAPGFGVVGGAATSAPAGRGAPLPAAPTPAATPAAGSTVEVNY